MSINRNSTIYIDDNIAPFVMEYLPRGARHDCAKWKGNVTIPSINIISTPTHGQPDSGFWGRHSFDKPSR